MRWHRVNSRLISAPPLRPARQLAVSFRSMIEWLPQKSENPQKSREYPVFPGYSGYSITVDSSVSTLRPPSLRTAQAGADVLPISARFSSMLQLSSWNRRNCWRDHPACHAEADSPCQGEMSQMDKRGRDAQRRGNPSSPSSYTDRRIRAAPCLARTSCLHFSAFPL